LNSQNEHIHLLLPLEFDGMYNLRFGLSVVPHVNCAVWGGTDQGTLVDEELKEQDRRLGLVAHVGVHTWASDTMGRGC